MASQTPDFGLNYFGGDTPGSLTDDGGKFTNGDRLLISRVLKALEDHDHKGGDRLTDPTGPPGVGLDSSNGQLPGGLNVYYRVSYVDKFGLETAASLETVQPTPSAMLPPTAPTLVTAAMPSGDTAPGLSVGSYSYALTAIAGDAETPLGDQANIDVTDGALPTVVVTFPDVVDDTQDSWGVWRMADSDAGWTKVDVITIDNLDFTDDGSVPANACACDPGQGPPTENLTASTNSITVSVPDPDLVGQVSNGPVVKWRLYRTYTSGSYANSSLVAEVTSTVNEDGTGGLITDWTDDGSVSLQVGAPLEVSQCLTPSIAITGGGGVGSLVPNPILTSPDGTIWRLDASTDGHLLSNTVTTFVTGTEYPIGNGPVFIAPDNTTWRVLVGDDGSVVAVLTEALPEDVIYPSGKGPRLWLSSSSAWRMEMENGGALTLVSDPGPAYAPSDAPILTASDGSHWQIVVDGAGDTTVVSVP